MDAGQQRRWWRLNSVKVLANLLKTQKKPSGSDYTATVTRVDGNTAYVQLTGSEITDTPVSMTVNASPGDKVRVRIANGKAWLTGSDSAPPTNDAFAKRVSAKLTEEIESTNVVVRAVDKVVQAVKKIADNTNQYFWHTESGADTGAHITEIPQDEFLADPEHGGGNLLARSNGIAVRDGLEELAQFSADGIGLGVDETVLISANEATKRIWESGDFGWFDLPCEVDFSGSFLASLEDGAVFYIIYYTGPGGGYTAFTFRKGKSSRQEALYPWVADYDGETTVSISFNESTYSSVDVSARASVVKRGGVLSFGKRSGSNGMFSASFGEGLIASGDDQVVIGTYNQEDDQKALIIGNGTASSDGQISRSNAFAVSKGGALEVADPGTTRKNFGIDAGTLTGSSVAANSYADLTITFGKTFTTAPVVVAGFLTNSTGVDMGSLSCSVHSLTTTGGKVRIYNNSSNARVPYITWIAIG
jgi:hypothetical protein